MNKAQLRSGELRHFLAQKVFLKNFQNIVDKRGILAYNKHRRQGTDENEKTKYADVAHLVERHLAKVEVASSSLVIRSKF